MDRERFDALAWLFAQRGTRRGMLGALLGGSVAGVAVAAAEGKRRGAKRDKGKGKTRGKGKARAKGKGPGGGEGGLERGGKAQVRSAQGGKVEVCHVDDLGDVRRLEVPAGALGAHLGHGDFVPAADGGCCTAADCDPGLSCAVNRAADPPTGACATCDVCAEGCPYQTLQQALDAPEAPATIRICAGRFPTSAVVARDVTILGAGAGEDPAEHTILDGGKTNRVLEVTGPHTVTIRDLAIANGKAVRGAGVWNSANLTLEDVLIAKCEAASTGEITFGGGLANEGGVAVAGGGVTPAGTVTLERCTIADCTSRNAGGGVSNRGTTTLGQGTVTLRNSLVTGCSAGSGGGVSSGGGITTLENTEVTGCAAAEGGGIYNDNLVRVNLRGTTRIWGNSSADSEGMGMRGRAFCDPTVVICGNPDDEAATFATNCNLAASSPDPICVAACLGNTTPGSGACPA